MFRPRRSDIFIEKENCRPITGAQLGGYRRLLRRGRMMLAVIALVAGTMSGLVMPLVVRNIVGVIFVERNLDLLNRFTALLALVFLAQAFFSFVNCFNPAMVEVSAGGLPLPGPFSKTLGLSFWMRRLHRWTASRSSWCGKCWSV